MTIRRVILLVGIMAITALISSCTDSMQSSIPGDNTKTYSSVPSATVSDPHSDSELSSENEDNADFKEGLLTESEALEIAKEVIASTKPELTIDIDRTIIEDGKSYYIIHAYYKTMVNSEVGQSFTMGWYRLNRETGKLYKSTVESKEEKWILMN